MKAAQIIFPFVVGTIALGCGGARGANPQDQRAQTPTAATLVAGRPAPDFTAQDIDGKSVTLSSHIGQQVVLLDFIATWCEPCALEFPHLRTLYRENREKGFIIIAISVDGPETVSNVPGFARRNQLDFPMLLDEDSRIASLYNPKKSAPVTVLIDRSGKIVSIHEGFTPGDEVGLAANVESAIRQPRASR